MVKKSKIDIFNVMSEDELTSGLKNMNQTVQEYRRFIAMSCIAEGIDHNVVARILRMTYQSIYRWAKACSKGGVEDLMPNFGGGKPPELSINQKLEFGNIIYLSDEEVSMTEARQILIDKFDVTYSLSHVSTIVKDLGFDYTSSRPEYIESPENKEEILKERILEANITDEDILVGVDESTMKTGNKTKKRLVLRSDKKNNKK